MTAAPTSRLISSSKQNPCPVCGRTKDGDCRIGSDGMTVICHHPKDCKPGEVINGWAFTGNTKDGRAGHFRLDTRKEHSSTRREVLTRKTPKAATKPVPIVGPITLSRLPEPIPYSKERIYSYSPTQRVRRLNIGDKKTFRCQHLVGDQWLDGAGPTPWEAWQEEKAREVGGWILETEGEECCKIAMAGGVVTISQPGHAHTVEQIRPRYARLRDAGVDGVVYLADNDAMGQQRAGQAVEAAAAEGLPLVVLAASEVWDQLPEGGSIDDAPGSPQARIAMIETTLKANHAADCQARKAQNLQPQSDAPTFEERWEALELYATELANNSWTMMKSIASLADKASELGISRLSQRHLEQLLEAAQRKIRVKSAPVMPGGTFTIKPAIWAVDGIFRHGLNLLVGQSGAGKSRLSAACMAAWLRGDQTWLDRQLHGCEARHRHALIIGSDQTLEDWHITLGPVGLSWKAECGDDQVQISERLTLYALETGNQLDADGLATIRRWVDHHSGGMILIDSLAACLPAGVEEDKPSAARPIHALQEAIGDAWAILTHHTRKGAGKECNLGVGAGRGSGAIDAAVSRVIGLGLIHKIENGVLVPQELDPRRELLSTKRGGKTIHLVVKSDERGYWSVLGTAEELKRQQRKERALSNLTEAQSNVLAALEAKDAWCKVREVVKATSDDGEPYNSESSKAAHTRKVLKRLEVLGLVKSQRAGSERTYQATSHCLDQSLTDEMELIGSDGSGTTPQGVSLVQAVVQQCSDDPSEPVPAIHSENSELEPPEPGAEPAAEPPKPAALQGLNHLNHPFTRADSAEPINPEFPVGADVEVHGPLGWLPGYVVESGPDAEGVLKLRSLNNSRSCPAQPHKRNVRLVQREAA